MATLTLNASINADGSVTVTRGTGGALSGSVAFLIDNTLASKLEMWKLIEAIERALSRDDNGVVKPANLPTSGTSTE